MDQTQVLQLRNVFSAVFFFLRPVSNVVTLSLDCLFLIVSGLSILDCLWIVYSWLSLDCLFLIVSGLSFLDCLWIVFSWLSLDCLFLIVSGLSFLDCLWIVYSWLLLRFSLTFINLQTIDHIKKIWATTTNKLWKCKFYLQKIFIHLRNFIPQKISWTILFYLLK
jgi:hypothetical protein